MNDKITPTQTEYLPPTKSLYAEPNIIKNDSSKKQIKIKFKTRSFLSIITLYNDIIIANIAKRKIGNNNSIFDIDIIFCIISLPNNDFKITL